MGQKLLKVSVSKHSAPRIPGGWSSLCFLIYWRRLEQVLPAAITLAWATQIKEFTSRNSLNPNVTELKFE